MGDKTKIEWTDASWTPIRARWFEPTDDGGGRERVGWHCEHMSEGCRFCYSESFNIRLGTGLEFKPGALFREEKRGYHNGDAHLFLDEKMLLAPLRWKRPRMIFVCSMTDLFADFVPDEWIDRVFAVMALAPQHTFQILTKRSKRMREYLTARDGMGNSSICRAINEIPAGMGDRHGALEMPLVNCWLGVSCEDQPRADQRVPDLLATPAAVRFVSAEPLLGPIRFDSIEIPQEVGTWVIDALHCEEPEEAGDDPMAANTLDWIIGGGESGPGARPMHPDWARSIRDQCDAASVSFFFKQWGEFHPDGQAWPDGTYGLAEAQGVSPTMTRVGKKRAGRLLDGREHNEMPSARK